MLRKLVVPLVILNCLTFAAFGQSEWFLRATGTTSPVATIAYGSGFFTAPTATSVLTSPDGIIWSSGISFVGYSSSYAGFSEIEFGGGVWVASGPSFGGVLDHRLFTSINGHTWTYRSSPLENKEVTGLSYGNGTFVAVCADGYALRSTNLGQTWELGITPISDRLESVTFGNGTFVAVGWASRILTSGDGYLWTLRASPYPDQWTAAFFGNGKFFAFRPGSGAITSTDGFSWNSAQSFPYSAYSMAFGNGLYVGVGGSGSINASSDGVNWSARTSGVATFLSSVAFGNGTWVATSSNGFMLTSLADNPSSPLLVPQLNIEPAVAVHWQTHAGFVYQVQRSTQPGSDWQDVGNPIVGDGTSKTYYESTGVPTHFFG